MKLSNEKKFFAAVLLFYWLGLIIATHIPVPYWVRTLGVSDKTMHFAAYMILTMLLWLTFFFDVRANWRKFQPWIVLLLIGLHGIADELTQHYIAGRSTDRLDLASDMFGAAAALLIVTFISGYHAMMALAAITPVFLPAIVKAEIIKQNSITETVLYSLVFALITGAWGQYLSRILKLDLRKFKHLLVYIAGPTAVLASIKLYAIFTDKPFGYTPLLWSLLSVFIVLLVRRIIPDRKS
jgi:hypothetical protein